MLNYQFSMFNEKKSKAATEVMRQHRPPGIPVMRPFLAPYIQFIPDAFIIEDLGKFPAGGRVFIITAAGQDMYMLASPDLFQNIMISQVAHIMKRTVEVDIIVKIALCIF